LQEVGLANKEGTLGWMVERAGRNRVRAQLKQGVGECRAILARGYLKRPSKVGSKKEMEKVEQTEDKGAANLGG